MMEVHRNYKLQEIIGTGTFGTVHKCKRIDSKDGEMFAVKLIEVQGLTAKEKVNLKREINLLKMTKHENIVELTDCFLSDDQCKMCIVMEFCAGGTLRQYIDRKRHIKENTCLSILRQMCEAVKFLHLNAIIHRDIKPTNVLLTVDKTVKLADFGVAKIIDCPEMMKLTRLVGTPNYMSPEMVSGKPYDEKVDIWGIGTCMHEMMGKKPVFVVDSLPQLREEMIKYKEPETSNLLYSTKLKQILKQLLHKDSIQRPTTVQVLLWIQTFHTTAHEITSAGNGSQHNDEAATRSLEISHSEDSVHARHVFPRVASDPNTPPSTKQCNPNSTLSSTCETEDDNGETSGYETAPGDIKERTKVKSLRKRNSTSPSIHIRFFADELGVDMADEMKDIVRQTLDMPDHEFLEKLEQLMGTDIIEKYRKEIFNWRKALKPWQNASWF